MLGGAKLLTFGCRGEGVEKGTGNQTHLKGIPSDLLIPIRPPPVFYHLPTESSNYESINALTH
jgi:hypothetical protein